MEKQVFGADVLVVGGGLAGSVAARELAERGKQVLILEKRGQPGGNLCDEIDEAGIRVHLYGPHIFHTNEERLVRYIQRFGIWKPYRIRCMAQLDGKFVPTPFGFAAIDLLYPKEKAEQLKKKLIYQYGAGNCAPVTKLLESGDEEIRAFAQLLFEKDFAPYAAKQWSLPVSEISPQVMERVPVWFSYQRDYYQDRYQLLPQNGYSVFFEQLLNHPNITVALNCNALRFLKPDRAGKRLLWSDRPFEKTVVYTGPVDALFHFAYGALPYRSLVFRWKTLNQKQFQPAPVVAYPQAAGFTRITEYKQLTGGAGSQTTIAQEYPFAADAGAEPYYPVPTQETAEQMERYRTTAKQIKNLFLCGRLAEYRYYNMDQTIASALEMAQKLSG